MLRWWYISIATCTVNIYLHDKENKTSILSNLRTKLFRINLPKDGITCRGHLINSFNSGWFMTLIYIKYRPKMLTVFIDLFLECSSYYTTRLLGSGVHYRKMQLINCQLVPSSSPICRYVWLIMAIIDLNDTSTTSIQHLVIIPTDDNASMCIAECKWILCQNWYTFYAFYMN